MKRLATNVKDLTLKLRQTLQDFPFFGSKEANDDAVLPEGWTAIDTENMRIHIHDGSTRGGKTLPNTEDVENAIASANTYTDSIVTKRYQTFDLMIAAHPTPAVGESYLVASGGLVTYTITGWFGNLGSFAAAAPSINVAVGSTANVNGMTLVYDGLRYREPFAFVPTLTGGILQQATLPISAGISQRVALPVGTYLRLTWFGYGPFAYRQGDASVVATSSDSPANVGPGGIILKTSDYIAVYGIGAGTLVAEGGDVA